MSNTSGQYQEKKKTQELLKPGSVRNERTMVKVQKPNNSTPLHGREHVSK